MMRVVIVLKVEIFMETTNWYHEWGQELNDHIGFCAAKLLNSLYVWVDSNSIVFIVLYVENMGFWSWEDLSPLSFFLSAIKSWIYCWIWA